METISGTIIEIKEEKLITDNFRKQEFGLKTDPLHERDKPQEILFEVVNDCIEMLQFYKEGDHIEMQYLVRGKKSKGRYYNALRAIHIKFYEG